MVGPLRGHWGSSGGSLLATLGSAVGLGNVWRFSYVAGLIQAHHGVIAGWVLKYLWLHLPGSTQGPAGGGFATGFRDFIAHPVEPIDWQFAAMHLTTAIVVAGVERGIETISK